MTNALKGLEGVYHLRDGNDFHVYIIQPNGKVWLVTAEGTYRPSVKADTEILHAFNTGAMTPVPVKSLLTPVIGEMAPLIVLPMYSARYNERFVGQWVDKSVPDGVSWDVNMSQEGRLSATISPQGMITQESKVIHAHIREYIHSGQWIPKSDPHAVQPLDVPLPATVPMENYSGFYVLKSQLSSPGQSALYSVGNQIVTLQASYKSREGKSLWSYNDFVQKIRAGQYAKWESGADAWWAGESGAVPTLNESFNVNACWTGDPTTPLANVSPRAVADIKADAQKTAPGIAALCYGDDKPTDAPSVPGGFAAQITATVAARGNAYGSPAENHQTTADMLSTWLSRRLNLDIRLSAEDVCTINIIQKVSRAAFCSKDDTWLDVAGYVENIALIRSDQRNHRVVAKQNDRNGFNGTLCVGDVVRLKSGNGGDMTINRITHSTKTAECVFFDGDKAERTDVQLDYLVFVRR
jgi:uncharacterized protein YodC (DUF2158 family)